MINVKYQIIVTHHSDGVFEFRIKGIGKSLSEIDSVIDDLIEIVDLLDDGEIKTEFLQ